MSITKEFREFFLRNTQVNSGSKPDQESGFITSYLVNGVSKFNRFLKGNYPSESVMKKFLESITFKLNQEDTAQITQQGLAKIATDINSINRISNDSSTDFTAFITPHQLPEIVLSINILTDVISGSSVVNKGLRLTKYIRTISGKSRLIWLLEVIPLNSLEFDNSGNLQLVNDVDSPTINNYYGTDNNANKGWYNLTSFVESKIKALTNGLDYDAINEFTINTNTATPQLVTGCSLVVPSNGDYVIMSNYRVSISIGTVVAFKMELKKNGISGVSLGQSTIHIFANGDTIDFNGFNTLATGLIAGDTIDLVITPIIQAVSISKVYNRTITTIKVK